jgi:endonuclease/exonuclease/phosphatase (EEP) superfamily protein YafD
MTTTLRYLTALGLVAVLAISLLGFLPGWPDDMLTPFRPQLLAAAVLGLGVSAALKARWLIDLAATIALVVALPMATRLIERPVLLARPAAHAQPLSVVFSNVLCDNRHYDRVLTLARQQDADIFAAAETTPIWVDHLNSLSDIYPYHVAPRDLGIFGIALYAKHPFTAQMIKTGSRGMALIRADFGSYVVYVAHPMPPSATVLTEDNRVYLESLAARVATETKPVIIAGDLNATLWSHNLKPLIRQKLQWPHGSGLAYSWPVGRPWMRIQIDQVLTLGAVAGQYHTLGDVGSDHYPVRADLTLPNVRN